MTVTGVWGTFVFYGQQTAENKKNLRQPSESSRQDRI